MPGTYCGCKIICVSNLLLASRELQGAWADQFGIDCQPVGDQSEWPSKEELLALLEKQDQRIQDLLTEVSEDRLAEVARPEKGDATIAERIAHGLIDEAKHCGEIYFCLLYTSPSPRDATLSRMPSSA